MNIYNFLSFVFFWKFTKGQNYNLFYPNGSRFYGTLRQPPRNNTLPPAPLPPGP